MSEQELIEQWEKYLKGELSPEERKQLELLIESNVEMREKLSQHKEFLQRFKQYGNRKAIKTLAQEAQREMDIDRQKKKKTIYSKPYLAVAASVSILIVAALSFYSGYLYYSANSSQHSYRELSKQIESISRKQDALIRNNDSDKKSVEEADLSGTGFMISSNGYILTCNHVVQDAQYVQVYNKVYGAVKAKVVSFDKKYDLALLKIETTDKKAPFKIPFSIRKKNAEPGEEVFTMAYPRNDIVYGEGSISAASGFDNDSLAYQISVPVNPGNSGAPLIDDLGNVTGIIKGKQDMSEGTGFAVKSTYILKFLETAAAKGEIKLSTKNNIAYLSRKDKIRKLQPVVFQVKLYK